jgi:hypothetical protein
MTTSIHDAINQARAAAGQLATAPGALITYTPRPISLMDNLAGPFAVDTWLKVKSYGMTIGKDTTTLFDQLTLHIDLAGVFYCRRVRYGNPVEYRTTYDGDTDARGGLWTDTLARARASDPRCQGDYRSADIAMIAIADIKARDATTVLLEKGRKIGYAPAVTGWNGWADLIRRLLTAGIDPERGVIEVSAKVQYNRNASGEWGTVIRRSTPSWRSFISPARRGAG